MAVDAAVLACSEQQTGGADMNRGYDREASMYREVLRVDLGDGC